MDERKFAQVRADELTPTTHKALILPHSAWMSQIAEPTFLGVSGQNLPDMCLFG